MKTFTITNRWGSWNCYVQFGAYSVNGRIAITLIDVEDGFPVCKASVNIPNAPCLDGHTYIKGWSENEGVEDCLVEHGIIGDACGMFPTGRCVASLHKVLITDRDKWNAEVTEALKARHAA